MKILLTHSDFIENKTEDYVTIKISFFPDNFYIVLDDFIREKLFDKAKKAAGNEKELSKILKTGRGNIWKWEKGKRALNLRLLKELCKIANFNLNELQSHVKGLKGDTYSRQGLKIKFPFIVDEKWAYFSGLLTTDGHISNNFKRVEIANNDVAVLSRFEKFLTEIGVDENSINIKKWNQGLYFRICNRTFARIMNSIFEIPNGNKNSITYVPEIIKKSPKSVIASFIRGAYDGDGWVVKRTLRVGISCKSRNFIFDIHKLLLQQFGINNYFRGPNRQNKYLCEITGYENVKKFQDFINFENSKRKESLQKILKRLEIEPHYSSLIVHKLILDKIDEHEEIDAEKLCALLDRDKGTISYHLRNLYSKGFLERRKEGKKFLFKVKVSS